MGDANRILPVPEANLNFSCRFRAQSSESTWVQTSSVTPRQTLPWRSGPYQTMKNPSKILTTISLRLQQELLAILLVRGLEPTSSFKIPDCGLLSPVQCISRVKPAMHCKPLLALALWMKYLTFRVLILHNLMCLPMPSKADGVQRQLVFGLTSGRKPLLSLIHSKQPVHLTIAGEICNKREYQTPLLTRSQIMCCIIVNMWRAEVELGMRILEKRFLCKYCDKLMADRRDLRRHHDAHERTWATDPDVASGRFSCKLCPGRNFTLRWSLQRHMKKQHSSYEQEEEREETG